MNTKKLLTFALALAMIFCMIFAVSCDVTWDASDASDSETVSESIESPESHEHDWGEGEVTTVATYDADGVKTYTCTVCGQTKTEKIDKLEHNYSQEWSKDATNHWHACTDEGYETLKKDEAAHTFNDGEVTTAATYDADGTKTFTCTVCGQTKTEKVDKLTHNYSQEWSKDATNHWHACTDEGYETLKKDEAAHTFNDGEVTTAATIDADGVKTFTCTVCGQTKTEKIDKLESVTISFSGIERDSIRIEKGTTTTIEEPVKADNVFVNWTADGKVVDVTAAFNEDITLTANFKEGYNFKKNHAGATATTTMAGAKAGTVTESSIFETGIRYNFPSKTSDNDYYVVTLPCINYSNFKVVAFNWKAMGWTQVGLKNVRGHMQNDFVGTLQVVKVGNDYKAIWMNYGNKDHCWETTISDTDIINGNKGLDYVYALTYSEDRWLDIEVSGVSHVYNDGVLQRVAISENGDKMIIRNGENVYDPGENSGNWTVALQAIDYTQYTSVTFNWKFSYAKARIGLNSVTDIVEKNTDDNKAMKGTLVISKNAEGQYVATLTNTSEDGGTITKVLSDDVANGKKGLVIYFGSDIIYRGLSFDADPTFEALPAE